MLRGAVKDKSENKKRFLPRRLEQIVKFFRVLFFERQWKHDCDNCKFLGMFKDYDLYFCNQGGNIPTVIARYGNEGHEYLSGISPRLTNDGPLYIAKMRAIGKGFYET